MIANLDPQLGEAAQVREGELLFEDLADLSHPGDGPARDAQPVHAKPGPDQRGDDERRKGAGDAPPQRAAARKRARQRDGEQEEDDAIACHARARPIA